MRTEKYGVWGYGIVGKSLIRHLYKKGYQLSVMDKRTPSKEELHFLTSHNALFFPQTAHEHFFTFNDHIIISPGIDRPKELPQEKIIEELDLFCAAWKKKLIAVTGSLGKTSTVELLYQLMTSLGSSVALGGNVGTGMLDLLPLEEESEYALLELSSFQLEHSTRCTPDIAVWLNFYPNHLDRHHTLEQYFLAKYALIRNQEPSQKALVHLSLRDQLREQTQKPLYFFSMQKLSDALLKSLGPLDTFYGKHGSTVLKITNDKEETLSREPFPHLSFEENWLALIAVLDLLGLPHTTPFFGCAVKLPEHRLEKVATVKGITFYNDSKSSIFEATQAALEKLQPERVHLLLGGVSKGVDRTLLIPQLKEKVVSIHCFGKEAESLFKAALEVAIPAYQYAFLEEACISSFKNAVEGDLILFSPAGASFDLFSNYKERGDAFKAFVYTQLCS